MLSLEEQVKKEEAADKIFEESAPLIALPASAIGAMKLGTGLSKEARTRLASRVARLASDSSKEDVARTRSGMMDDLSVEEMSRATSLLRALTRREIKDSTSAKAASDKTDEGRALVVSAAAVCALLRVPEPTWKVARRVIRDHKFVDLASNLKRSQMTDRSASVAREVLKQYGDLSDRLLSRAIEESGMLSRGEGRLSEHGSVGRLSRALVLWATVMSGKAHV
jgi:hypothetical protein